jgi:DNA-binding NarL/FixJ family response regulator
VKTRVTIVEDIGEIRAGLALLINGAGDFACTAAYRTMEEAIEGIRRDPPDVALVDIGLPACPESIGFAF